MKNKIILLCICFVNAVSLYAQLPGPVITSGTLNSTDGSKTMARQQSLTNFLQAAASNLTSNTKSAQLKASIFALNWRDSIKKYNDDYYLKHTWQRNMQVQAGGGMDANGSFNSVSAGLSYDVLNYRDVTRTQTYNSKEAALDNQILSIQGAIINDMTNAKQREWADILNKLATEAINRKDTAHLRKKIIEAIIPVRLRDSAVRNDTDLIIFCRSLEAEISIDIARQVPLITAQDSTSSTWNLAVDVAGDYYITPLLNELTAYYYYIFQNSAEPPVSMYVDPGMLADFKTAANKKFQSHAMALHGKNLVEVYTYIEKEYQATLNRIKLRPLLTIGYLYSYNTTVIQNQHIPYVSFLWGFGKHANRPWQLSGLLSDSVSTDTLHKTNNYNLYAVMVGIGKVFVSDANANSIFEADLNLEYDHTTSIVYTKDKRDNYFVGITFKARPTVKSPWIDVVVKRDMQHANFAGFLNVTFNLTNPNTSN